MTRPAGETVEDRFWRKVRKTSGCWKWIGARTGLKTFSYGAFWRTGERISAHRFSWELHNGPVPEGLSVLHKCDNPLCVRPDHLFLGTQSDNAKDMIHKARNVAMRGEQCGAAKLTEVQVLEIRDMPGTLREIASFFGVHHKTIMNIKHGKQWRHVL